MAVFPKPFLKPKPENRRAETMAAKLLAKCTTQLGLSEVPLPVPVEKWIEHPLDISFGVTDLNYLGDRTLGAAFVAEKEILVSDKLVGQDGPFRFTCAHELGHLTLHRKVGKTFKDSEGEEGKGLKTYEREADRFAAAFLMPVPLLIAELFAVIERRGLDKSRCLTELMLETDDSHWLWRRNLLPFLTRRFGVSLSALLNRFSDLILPDDKPFLLNSRHRLLLKAAERY